MAKTSLQQGENIACIPDGVMLGILGRMGAEHLGTFGCVSRGWRQLAETEELWEVLCDKRWKALSCIPHKRWAARQQFTVSSRAGMKTVAIPFPQQLLARDRRAGVVEEAEDVIFEGGLLSWRESYRAACLELRRNDPTDQDCEFSLRALLASDEKEGKAGHVIIFPSFNTLAAALVYNHDQLRRKGVRSHSNHDYRDCFLCSSIRNV